MVNGAGLRGELNRFVGVRGRLMDGAAKTGRSRRMGRGQQDN